MTTMTRRSIQSVHSAHRDDIGDLVTRRPVPGPGLPQVDPFLFLNHHGPQTYSPGNGGLPFGPHPHRGFETVTFVIEGSLAHHDTGGGTSVVGPGGVQWMTAGRGLVHAELSPEAFKKDGGPLEILQLWVNLPARLKMTDPDYHEVPAREISVVELAEGVTFRAVSGTESAPVRSLTGVTVGLIDMAAGSRAELSVPAGRNPLFYTVRGSIEANGSGIEPYRLVRFADDGDTIAVHSAEGCLILFGHAEPLDEPVVAHGPFVMNSQEEIAEAVRAYQRGEFGDPRALARG